MSTATVAPPLVIRYYCTLYLGKRVNTVMIATGIHEVQVQHTVLTEMDSAL